MIKKQTDNYLDTTKEVYKQAALKPDVGLCCTTTPIWQLPGLKIPGKMIDMNYGCGSTVNSRDLVNNPTVLYVGVGGGMELLQFSWFSRREGAIIGIDPVDEMLFVSSENMLEAEQMNPWFSRNFITLRKGDARNLPVENESVDVAAQNCLFNIFRQDDLKKALDEMYRVLKPHGRLVMSDPVCEKNMPDTLRNDARLRALCISGALPIHQYIQAIADAGFGTIEVRARRPYRILSPNRYQTGHTILTESIEVCAIKDPVASDGPCVFTGKTAIYYGKNPFYDDGKGHMLLLNQPLAICDKTAKQLKNLGRNDIFISSSTWHYDGGGCC